MTSFSHSVPDDHALCDLCPDPFCHDLFHRLVPYLFLALLELGCNRQDQRISLFKEQFGKQHKMFAQNTHSNSIEYRFVQFTKMSVTSYDELR